jgi:hypothetical protein
MIPIIPIITSIVAPILGKIVTHYLEPKVTPIVQMVKTIERDTPDLPNTKKHNDLKTWLELHPDLAGFIKKCGWNENDVHTMLRFVVLMTKKPPTDRHSIDRWNEDDTRVIFNFFLMLARRWRSMKK